MTELEQTYHLAVSYSHDCDCELAMKCSPCKPSDPGDCQQCPLYRLSQDAHEAEDKAYKALHGGKERAGAK